VFLIGANVWIIDYCALQFERKITMSILSIENLRNRIRTSGAESEIVRTLGLDISALNFASQASDAQILAAFFEASIKLDVVRRKLHRRPFPDFKRLGIYTGDNPEYHIVGGFGSASEITARADRFGFPIDRARRVLDFGCGTSRILRYFVEFMPGPRYYGSEVFKDNIEWGRKAFPEVMYIEQGHLPPLPVQEHTFDLVYAYSIFSHFDQVPFRSWLREFARIINPGGLLIITVQGWTILKRCLSDPMMAASLSMTDVELGRISSQFEESGFAFHRCYDHSSLSAGGLDAEIFGLTYVKPDYLRTIVSPNFVVLDHEEGAIAAFQDWVVLKRN
jgi:SAM-dependent methyltransferase